jgi:hypothetical protein
MAMAALAISSRSMVAIRRLNNEAEGARPKEAVLDILFPYCSTVDRWGCALSRNLGMPDASSNLFVCIAAFFLLQCNINETICFSNSKRAAQTGGPFKHSIDPAIDPVGYSAATFRGGSSAPESWISAT